MPNAPSTAVSLRWQPVAETLAEFREECLGFEYEVGSLLDQFEQLQTDLERKDRELNAAWDEVFAARAELSDTRAELKAARAEAQKEIDLARDGVRAELSRAHDIAPAPPDANSPTANEHFAEIERERTALEAELELVRGRAAELYNVVAEQKREMARQRDETTAELKLLRKLLEQQSDHFGSAPAAPSEPPPVALKAVPKPPVEHVADPVVNSVMAQFAKLQQDVAQRRKQRK